MCKPLIKVGRDTWRRLGVVALALGLASSPAGAGEGREGGSLGGNGAGIVEQNAMFAYQSLPRAISQCLNMPSCALSPSERGLLVRIQGRVLASQRSGEAKIKFVSATEKPGFFDTAPGQFHRFARTELRDSLIYFNTDQLYTAGGQPAVEMPALSAILVHEFGHQVGFEDHQQLDVLGAKVRLQLAAQSVEHLYDRDGLHVVLRLANYAGLGNPVDIVMTTGQQVRSLGQLVLFGAKCDIRRPAGVPRVVGWKLSNGHFERSWIRSLDSGEEQMILVFQAWLQLDCLEEGTINTQTKDLELQLSFTTPTAEIRTPVFVGSAVQIRSSNP